jgi:hypothetical protein
VRGYQPLATSMLKDVVSLAAGYPLAIAGGLAQFVADDLKLQGAIGPVPANHPGGDRACLGLKTSPTCAVGTHCSPGASLMARSRSAIRAASSSGVCCASLRRALKRDFTLLRTSDLDSMPSRSAAGASWSRPSRLIPAGRTPGMRVVSTPLRRSAVRANERFYPPDVEAQRAAWGLRVACSAGNPSWLRPTASHHTGWRHQPGGADR